MLTLLAALQAVTVPAPPAPPPPLVRTEVQVPRIAPPPPIAVARRERSVPITVKVRVTERGIVLFEDRLSVADQGARVLRTRSEAVPPRCGPLVYTRAENFSVSLTRLSSFDTASDFVARVEWTRPPLDPCQGGSRTIELSRIFAPTPGVPVVAEGDGGLRIQLEVER